MEKLYGLLGRRLGHSWSVPIHQALGCEGYRLMELEPEALEAVHDYLTKGDVFPQRLIDVWTARKRAELKQMEQIPNPAEFKMYYDL